MEDSKKARARIILPQITAEKVADKAQIFRLSPTLI
jgi:hypothetical protein